MTGTPEGAKSLRKRTPWKTKPSTVDRTKMKRAIEKVTAMWEVKGKK